MRMRAWRATLGVDPNLPGKLAHPRSAAFRWVRDYAGWKHSPLGKQSLHDGIPAEQFGDKQDDPIICPEDRLLIEYTDRDPEALVPLSEQAAVDAECAKWATLWKEDLSYNAPDFGQLGEEPLQLLSTWAIKQAAATFPAGTGLGADNISPRAICRLSDAAVSALAHLYARIEALGEWTAMFNLVLIVLLPKLDGGLRPIGLFPTIIRLWMRTRVCIARAWENAHALPSVYGGVAMGAYRAAWNENFAAEFAANAKADHLQALVDLVKCFETVPHAELVEAAKARGVSLVLLKLSLSSYRLNRSIGIEGTFSRLVVATRSITAGSGFATTELRILLFDVVLEAQKRWSPPLLITVFVDDLTLSASGAPAVIVKLVNRALSFLTHVIQSKLHMQVSLTKSLALSGRPTVSRALCKAMADPVVSHTRSARLLGADNSAGRRRSTVVARGRVKGVQRRIGKFQHMRQQGINSRTLTRASATASMAYGADAMGTSDTALAKMRLVAAKALSAPTAGKNVDLVFIAADLHDGSSDPAFLAHELPAKHWALAWWEGWQSPARLRAAFLVAESKVKRAKASPWQRASGAVAGYILTLRRVGWTPFPDRAVDDVGVTWHFARDSPAAISAAMQASVRRWRARRVANVLPSLVPSTPDYGTDTDQLMLLPIVGPLASLLQKGKCRSGLEWSAEWGAYLNSAISGGQWPQARRATLKNFQGSDSLCQLCMCEEGTLLHRLTCRYILPARGWQNLPTKAHLVNSLLSGDRLAVLSTRALLFALVKAPEIREDWFQWVLEPAANIDVEDCAWYTDGSLMDVMATPFVACGFAVLVVTRQGTLVGAGFGSPPTWITTAAGAEAWALRFVLSITATMPLVHTDCQALLHIATAGAEVALAANRKLARVWADIAHYVDSDFHQLTQQLVWIPAHKSLQQALCSKTSQGIPVSAINWRANRLVDVLAKRGASSERANASLIKWLDSARALVQHKAVTLGQATFLANNCKVDGVLKRDAVAKPPRNASAAEDSAVNMADSYNVPACSPFSLTGLARQLQDLEPPPSCNACHLLNPPAAVDAAASATVDATGSHDASHGSETQRSQPQRHTPTATMDTFTCTVGKVAYGSPSSFYMAALAVAVDTEPSLPSLLDNTSSSSHMSAHATSKGVTVTDGPSSAGSSYLPAPAAVDGAPYVSGHLASSSYVQVNDAVDASPATDVLSSSTLFAAVDADALIDTEKEDAALKLLPKPQPFKLHDVSAAAPRRSLPSRDPKDIAKRIKTARKAANTALASEQVRAIGERAEHKSSSAATTPPVSAADRIKAMRERIRAKSASLEPQG